MYEPSRKANRIFHLEATAQNDNNRVQSNKNYVKK